MKKLLGSIAACSLLATGAFAGNEQKSGQAGATELLINPWARSSGMASSHTAGIRGVEAIRLNVGGLSRVKGTEVSFCNTQWLKGSDINIYALGLAQPIGDNGGVIGMEIMSLDLGTFYNTTVNNPDSNIEFDTRFLNIGLSYSKAFSRSIYGGITVRIISESVPDASAQGVAFDAGIQYVTNLGSPSEDDSTGTEGNLRFGVSLKNVGPAMNFSGDGLSVRGQISTGTFETAINPGAQSFELPSSLNIGAAYDWNIVKDHRLTFAGNFNSNSFTKDQLQGGIEYAFMNMFMVRAGLDYQKNVFSKAETRFAHNGPTFGATAQVPFGIGKSKSFGVDYSFRTSNPFSGSHSIGVNLLF
jgi:hypothetical protein